MTGIKNYKDLNVWQKARILVKDIYNVSCNFPKNEQFGLTSQIKRSVVSVPSNIAEGHSRTSTKDYINYISISIGSLAEVETQLILAEDLGFVSNNETRIIFQNINELQRMLHGLRKSLKPNPK
ncbi:four helix bundle protein, partial [Rickettsiales bacterium]|nr:four helix bundle protein [Rickettsiales bacterium]